MFWTAAGRGVKGAPGVRTMVFDRAIHFPAAAAKGVLGHSERATTLLLGSPMDEIVRRNLFSYTQKHLTLAQRTSSLSLAKVAISCMAQ